MSDSVDISEKEIPRKTAFPRTIFLFSIRYSVENKLFELKRFEFN